MRSSPRPDTVLNDPTSHPISGASPGVVFDGGADITIRPLTSLADCQACVALQDEVWGAEYGDSVPASLLQVVTHVGGIVAGAFTPEGDLVGFVFGLTGPIDGEIGHWSHMLGVRESARNAGVGRMLKEYQRAELARRGIARMYWTFDPLMAKNAHLNLNRLGARVVEYVQNMYGTTGSPLHHGLATDRIVVVCATGLEPRQPAYTAAPSSDRCTVLTPEPQDGDVVFGTDDSERPSTLWIEVPADIQRVIASAPAAATAWHAVTRENFQWALGNGYSVTGLYRDPVTSRAFYVFELDPQTS